MGADVVRDAQIGQVRLRVRAKLEGQDVEVFRLLEAALRKGVVHERRRDGVARVPDEAGPAGGARFFDGLQDQGFRPRPVRPGAPHAARAPSGPWVDQQARGVFDANAGGRDVYPSFGFPEYRLLGPGVLRPVLPMMRHEGGASGPGAMAEKTSVLRGVPSVPRASLRSSPSRWKPARSATRALGRFSGSHRISTRFAPKASKAKAAMPRTASVV